MMINDVLSVLPAVSFEIFLNRTEDTFYRIRQQAGGIRQEAWLVCVGEHQRSKLKNAREIRLTSFPSLHSIPFPSFRPCFCRYFYIQLQTAPCTE